MVLVSDELCAKCPLNALNDFTLNDDMKRI